MELKEAEKIDLTKVEATEEEKSYWSGILAQEAPAKEKLEALEAAKAKITQQKEKAGEELRRAEESLTEKLLAWAIGGRARKGLSDLKQKIIDLQDLISDCEKALPLIEKEVHPCHYRLNRGRRIRNKIQDRMKGQEESQAKG